MVSLRDWILWVRIGVVGPESGLGEGWTERVAVLGFGFGWESVGSDVGYKWENAELDSGSELESVVFGPAYRLGNGAEGGMY